MRNFYIYVLQANSFQMAFEKYMEIEM